jgi:PKD repeat protein
VRLKAEQSIKIEMTIKFMGISDDSHEMLIGSSRRNGVRIFRGVLIFLAAWVAFVENGFSQIPVADFNLDPVVCLEQHVELQNNSSNSTSFFWDFCLTGFQGSPSLNLLGKASIISNLGAIEFVFDGQWFGFAPGRANNHLYRLDFPAGLTGGLTVVDLGTFGGALNLPKNIRLIKQNGIWVGILANVSNTLVRLRFDNGISQTPIAENLGNLGGMNAPIGLDIIKNGLDNVAIISSYGGVISIVNFGNSFLNTPSAGNMYSFSAAPVSGPVGIALAKDLDGVWRGIISSYNDAKIYKVAFINGLYQPPSFTLITSLPTPTEAKIIFEGGQYYGLVSSQSGKILRILFGDSIGDATQTVVDLGNFGVLASLDALSVAKQSGEWSAFMANANTGDIYRLVFDSTCPYVNALSSNVMTPVNIQYNQSGDYKVGLLVSNTQGDQSYTEKTVQVSAFIAPQIDFTSQNACVSIPIEFTAASPSIVDLVSFNWNFGDLQISSATSPSHQYAALGQYAVTLEVVSTTACKNRVAKTIAIFRQPISGFSPPTLSGKSCSLKPYPFTNQSTYDLASNPSWTWSINSVTQSTAQNLNHSFDSPGTYSIALKAEIPGCSTTISKDFIVEETGTLVDFAFANQCEGDQTLFTNNSIGGATGFLWDFGDGQTSTLSNPSHIFPSNGNYNVQLTASNAAGCANTKVSPITIASSPATDFFIDLPPFSCSGTPTQFHDATPPPPNSNITAWAWAFNDGTGTTSTLKDPLHTFASSGNYNVSLQVTTNFGCLSTVQKQIFVSASPNADFNINAACLNKPTQFVNSNSTAIKSWSWTIGNSFYSFANPVHTFTSPGNFPVSLLVKGNNNCEAMAQKNISVKPVPLLNYTTSAACTDAITIFTDTSVGQDAPASWLWDFGEGNTAALSPAEFTFSSSGAFPVTMNVVTQSGCEYSLTKNVTVAPSPVAGFTESVSFGQPPLPVQFTNTSTNSTVWLWEFRDALNSTSSSQSPSFTFSEIGDYLVQLTASNSFGCSDLFTKTITVLVPKIDLSLESLKVQENLSGGSVVPIITVKNKSNVSVFGTDVFVTGSSGARLKTNVTLNLAPNATIELQVPIELFSKEKFLCIELVAWGDLVASNNSACENLEGKPVIIHPYPNPTQGQFFFDAVLDGESVGELRIINSMGRPVLDRTFPDLKRGMNRIELNFSGNRPGLYYAIWKMDGATAEFKFILQ